MSGPIHANDDGRGTGPIVVCGGGAAGMAAALAAAGAGADVYLIEAAARVGGTVAQVLIHTLGGFYDSTGKFLHGGLVAELFERLTLADDAVRQRNIGRTWVLNVCPAIYQKTVEQWLAAERRITLLSQTRPVVVVTASNRVIALDVASPHGSQRLFPRAVIDTTGTAEVVRMISPELVYDDARPAAGGLIFTMRGVAPGALAFPRGVAVVRALHEAAQEGILPAECAHAWIDAGCREDEVYVKLCIPNAGLRGNRRKAAVAELARTPAVNRVASSGEFGYEDEVEEHSHARELGDNEIQQRALRTQAAVAEFLKTLPAFAAARVERIGTVGIRDGGRIRGEYCLTGADVWQGRRFEDAACRGCWPIEYWDSERGVSLEYLPEGVTDYDIPLRCLKVSGLRNVWAAGKCLSADREAHASARVVGTCWAMGAAVGRAAALCEPDEVPTHT